MRKVHGGRIAPCRLTTLDLFAITVTRISLTEDSRKWHWCFGLVSGCPIHYLFSPPYSQQNHREVKFLISTVIQMVPKLTHSPSTLYIMSFASPVTIWEKLKKQCRDSPVPLISIVSDECWRLTLTLARLDIVSFYGLIKSKWMKNVHTLRDLDTVCLLP